jgi:hypothetical protein
MFATSGVERIDRFLPRHAPQTPCVIIELSARIYYAGKADPAAPVIAILAELDIGFA